MFFFRFIFCLFFVTYNTSLTGQNLKTITLNYQELSNNKERIKNGDKALIFARNKLVSDANKILEKGVKYSVTENKLLRLNASNNDYMSFGRYWWPNNKTKNGLPYILKDGKVNKESDIISDKRYIDGISGDILTLSLAYYYTSNEKYSKWAVELLKTFFLDNQTKMNPNFNYSQVIPGDNSTGGSIMEAAVFLNLIDGIQILSKSSYYTLSVQRGIKNWFGEFLSWLETSPKGKINASHKNNRGTYYTDLKCSILMLIGEISRAKSVFESEAYDRINTQISGNGSMDMELKRGVPLGYVKYNLVGFRILTNIGKNLGYNIESYIGPKGQSIAKANEWLKQYQLGNKDWSYSKEAGITYRKSRELNNGSKADVNKLRFNVARFDNYLEVLTTSN